MVEINKIQFPNPEKSNAFKNVIAKIRNPALGNDAAWDETRNYFAHFVPEFPQKDPRLINLLKQIFNLRRDVFLGNSRDEELVAKIQEKLKESGITADQLSIISEELHGLQAIFPPKPQK